MFELGTFTGVVKNEYVEIETRMGVKRLCRPVFPFPTISRPYGSWVEKYKNKFFALIAYENNNMEKPLFMGLVPFTNNGLPAETLDGNVITMSEKFRLWFDDENNKAVIDALENGEILLGNKDVTEHAVLGDKLNTFLGKFIDEVSAITVPTAVGPSGVPVNVAQLQALKLELQQLLSTKVKLG